MSAPHTAPDTSNAHRSSAHSGTRASSAQASSHAPVEHTATRRLANAPPPLQRRTRDEIRVRSINAHHLSRSSTTSSENPTVNTSSSHLLALHPAPDPRRPPFLRRHPLPHRPRRIVPHMLPMPTLQPRRPVPFLILIKPDHRPLHRSPPANIPYTRSFATPSSPHAPRRRHQLPQPRSAHVGLRAPTPRRQPRRALHPPLHPCPRSAPTSSSPAAPISASSPSPHSPPTSPSSPAAPSPRSTKSAPSSSSSSSPHTLATVRTIAADTASRSSLAYAEILFRKFLNTHPTFLPAAADPIAMLQHADAAILIGDPALLALESPRARSSSRRPLPMVRPRPRVAHPHRPPLGRRRLGRPSRGPRHTATSPQPQLTDDLEASRDHGLAHIEDLVDEWTPRIAHPTRHHPPLPHPQHPLRPRPRLHPRHRALPPIRRRGRHPPAPPHPPLPLNNPQLPTSIFSIGTTFCDFALPAQSRL